VEENRYLGIHFAPAAATVVYLAAEGGRHTVLDCFGVVAGEPEKPLQQLARLVGEGCRQRQWQFNEAAVAVDCSTYTQHSVRSRFTDQKQIAGTVRFDAEETLAADVSNYAIAFRLLSQDGDGSDLLVYAAAKKMLSEVLAALQAEDIDPMAVEPDAEGLGRFIEKNLPPGDQSRMFCVLSSSAGYMLMLSGASGRRFLRSFLIEPEADRTSLLEAQVGITCAAAGETADGIAVFDRARSVDCRRMTERTGVPAEAVELAKSARLADGVAAGELDQVGFACACGAALGAAEAQCLDFRGDFSPYRGRKIRLEKTLRLLGSSVLVFMIALGLYFQLRLLQTNRYRSRLFEKLKGQYSAVVLDGRPAGDLDRTVSQLDRELRRTRQRMSGQLSVTGSASISAKLTLLLEAFNKSAARTDLTVDTISISTKTMSMAGSTSSRRNTLQLFEQVKKAGLGIQQQRLYSKAGRDNFHVTIEPLK
jgi:hypothetical protein